MSVFAIGGPAYPNSKTDFNTEASPRCQQREDGALVVRNPYGGNPVVIRPAHDNGPVVVPYK